MIYFIAGQFFRQFFLLIPQKKKTSQAYECLSELISINVHKDIWKTYSALKYYLKNVQAI